MQVYLSEIKIYMIQDALQEYYNIYLDKDFLDLKKEIEKQLNKEQKKEAD